MTSLSVALDFPFFPSPEPVHLSESLLRWLGTQVTVTGQSHIPANAPLVVISNHRSPLDAPVLMVGLGRSISFACHQYMANVPLMREVVEQFGAFPLATPRQFLQQARSRLYRHETVGIFPEGAKPMVSVQPPRCLNSFHSGFAHLALKTAIRPLALLPVALVSDDKGFESPIPLKLLGWFDPNEPLFQQSGGHPLVFYRKVEVRVGAPIWLTANNRNRYDSHSKPVEQLTEACWKAIHDLLHC